MAEVCPWFDNADTWEGTNIPTVTKLAIMKGLKIASDIVQAPPLTNSSNISRISFARRKTISDAVATGITNILTNDWVLSFVPYRYKVTNAWMNARFSLFGPSTNDTSKIYTDGSRKGDCASFAVVNINDDTIIKSNTEGRATSQRAELFGTIAATYLRPQGEKVSDPKFIVHTINKAINNSMQAHEWRKVDNRSLIRCVARLNAHGKGTFTWVKGHQKVDVTEDGMHNREADVQAKTLIESPAPPLIDEAWECVDDFFCIRDGKLFEGDIRKTVYEDVLKLEIEKLRCNSDRYLHDGWWMEAPANADLTKYGAFRFKIVY